MQVALFAAVGAAENCLCVFDVDRTLTGKQGSTEWSWGLTRCTEDKEINGVHDSAYSGGTLVLSDGLLNLDSTFCKSCYRGIVTAGDATGPGSAERDLLHKHLGSNGLLPSSDWSGPNQISSPLVVTCPDGTKQNCVAGIQKWYEGQNITISNSHVHFYDDRLSNVKPFLGTGFNARQISCGSRDRSMGGSTGLCGAIVEEVVADVGVYLCGGGMVLV
mmetsp:Transcript_23977/g.58206  ORF Transcript_23977/g.58206 Transcript_23977/m.58206 type:complete len:218 (+) Transcript_23977:47-700(+)